MEKRSEYEHLYEESIENPIEFWDKMAKQYLYWIKPYTEIHPTPFTWFDDGILNACYNCLDRHLDSDKPALIYNGDSGDTRCFTYPQVLNEVCKLSNFFIKQGLKKGDCVAIYMPMSSEAIFTMLACARLGITHTVVFGGFSSESLALRVQDSGASWIVSVDYAERGSKKIEFLKNVMQAVDDLNSNLKGVLIFDSVPHELNSKVPIYLWSKQIHKPEFVSCVPVESEHPLFYLYTSGSTGKPKGIIHSTAGYLLYAALTTKYCFDVKKEDIFGCTADVGWITGHTYVLYGPMMLGITTVIFGGLPTYPTPFRLFDVIEKCGITQFYTAPTLIRLLMKDLKNLNLEYAKNKTKSLRVIGSVGEPINKEAYNWFKYYFGNNKLPLVDTYWQTESGGVLICPVPGVINGDAECAGIPFLGIKPVVLKGTIKMQDMGVDNSSVVESDCSSIPGSEKSCVVENTHMASDDELGAIVIEGMWPGMARGILNDEKRFKEAYFNKFPGFYYTGDEGYCDKNGHFWIRGRADDVLNVSGHRLSTAEIESACCGENIVEVAVVGIPDEITGEAIVVFAVAHGNKPQLELEHGIRQALRKCIGPIVHPKVIYIVDELPKTRTGKIMRRVLRSTLMNDPIGDVSTCLNVNAIQKINTVIKNKSY
ncbi:Acetyl-coenzyme A synthetase [Astathelohania contejeani]|uniref:acetate--CoA ligase n=1 Tax=Astathelohania contejeani TaxID=164912 RepID=A0ABQ7I2W1_9MICR|nr:Acetyl-coenzyme A synthetase [Thelohania contejeani]